MTPAEILDKYFPMHGPKTFEESVESGSYLDAVLWEQSFDAFWGENVPSFTDFNWATNYRNSLLIGPDRDAYCYTSPGVGFLV